MIASRGNGREQRQRRRALAAAWHARTRLSWLGALALELAVLACAGLVYLVVREVTEGQPGVAIANAQRLHEIEAVLGVAWERSINTLALDHEVAGTLANWLYVWGHWPVIIAAAIGLYAARRDRYVLLRNSVVISGLLGFAFFAFLPMAPPRLAGIGLVDTVSATSSYHETMQPSAYTNAFAAMPSLHFGWNLLVSVALFTSTTFILVRMFAILMPPAMAFAVVATANHWVLDVVVGFLVVLVGLLLAMQMGATGSAGTARPSPSQTRKR